MAEKEEGSGEQDDMSFLRTSDIVALTCLASANREGVMGSERVCLCTEGFGNRMCSLENVSARDVPPDISMCLLYIYNALSMRALQEMMSSERELKGAGKSGGHRTLLYGHAVQLKHVQSEMFLACLSTCSSNDKLAFDVGVQESNEGESSWWTVHPASKQRSEGEKVRVGDDVILVSVATERYLHMAFSKGYMVIASFHQTFWNITSVSSGNIRNRHMGFLFGNDVVRLYHGNDECLTIPETWSDHPQHNMVIYEGGAAVHQARSLWRMELIRMKWHGALIGWDQVFRIRHITSGRYLSVSENAIQLCHKEKAEYDLTAFILCQNKDSRKQTLEEKEEEGMGVATIRYGETVAFVQHFKSQAWLSYQTTEVTKKGLGKVEEKKAVASMEGHMDDCYRFFMALDEESKSARVIRKCSAVLNRFLKGIDALQIEGNTAADWIKVDLSEVLKLMEDLIEYFSQPTDDQDFEEKQVRFRALRSRQDLFQEEGVLNMILDTIDKFSLMEALPDFSGLVGEQTQVMWENISTYLYLLVAAMIKGNHYNCAQFAASQRLDWLFGRLSNPQSAEGILDVLYCVLTESPEALNMINEGHIKSVISLLEKVGRDPKVLDVLSSLCEGNGMAVRSSQNSITENLLPCKDLLLQTIMRDHVSSTVPNLLVGVVLGSPMFKRWYYEAEIEHVEQTTKDLPFLRIGWGNTLGFRPFPGSGDRWGCNGVGDDYYSYGYDGKSMYYAGRESNAGRRLLQKGDIVGCALDLVMPEMRFTLNGQPTGCVFRGFNVDGLFFPVISMSALVSCRFLFGGTEGRLKHGPPLGYSAIVEAVSGKIQLEECVSFGELQKNIYSGPGTILYAHEPYVPQIVDISRTILPHFAMDIHQRLAENMHELWAQRKIELGWSFGDVRSETQRTHPCLNSFDRLPGAEKAYNTNLAVDTMKTIDALGYHLIFDQPPVRLRPVRLPQTYLQHNGYKPQPWDTREITVSPAMTPLVEALAKNTHNVWAREKIRRGWTFGLTEFADATQKRSPHLVPYDQVDPRIQEANRETAKDAIRAMQLFGVFLEPPAHEHDEAAEKQLKAQKARKRTYRAEATYAVTSGKWYFEFEVMTDGPMRVGWMDIGSPPDTHMGSDDRSYGFDGYLMRKWHQGAEVYGKNWKVNDIVGCFLDLNDRTVAFSLNGELLLDPSGSEMAFDNVIACDGFVPAMTFAAGQRARLNFGQDCNTLKFFTTCGLQEGYEPFCVNMYRPMPFWYGKPLSQFTDVDENTNIEVVRVPPTGTSPPCLKLIQKVAAGETGATEKPPLEFLRLSLPVKCNAKFPQTKDKLDINRKLREFQTRGSMASIKPMKMPSDDSPKAKKGRTFGKNLTAKSTHSSEDGTSQSKQPSFDDPTYDYKEPAALRHGSAGDLLSSEERAMAYEKIKELGSVDQLKSGNKKGGGGLMKMLRDKRRDDKLSTESRPNSQIPDEAGQSSRNGRREPSGEMPSSGPGRHATVKKKSSLKKKKRKDTHLPSEDRGGGRRSSMLPQDMLPDGTLVDDDALAMNALMEQVDEYYYGVRIFPGQDPANVWVGWVTPQFHDHSLSFISKQSVRQCRFSELDQFGNSLENLEFRNCYVYNAAEMLANVTDAANTKVAGLLIGCVIDTSIGELTFLAAGQDTGFKCKIEPGAMLYPAVFFTPSGSEVLQFELGRIKYTFPLSAAMFKSSNKSITSFCPPRLTVQLLRTYNWSRVPNGCLRTTALKLSDIRGWSILCSDPVRMMAVYVPEKDKCYDALELVEMPDYLTFHRQTLDLYCKLCSHGNHRVAHTLCSHVDEDQILYAIKSHYLSGPLRQGFHDLLIAVHLKTHVDARNSTANEYVIPLINILSEKNVFDDEGESRYPHIVGESISIRPVMVADPVQNVVTKDNELKLLPPTIKYEALKNHVTYALHDATEHAVINCRDLIGGDNRSHFEPILKLYDSLLVIGLMSDDDLRDLLKLIHPIAFDEHYEPGSMQKGLTEIDLDEPVKLQLCHLLNHLCDIQLRHRVESLIAFTEGFVGELQQDQCARYLEIKQTDMPPAEAAKRTKEFRCPPKEQMYRLLKCTVKEEKQEETEEDVEYDQCPMSESLQEQLREFCVVMVSKIGCKPKVEKAVVTENTMGLVPVEENLSWVDNLAHLVIKVPPPLAIADDSATRRGTENFRLMIINMLRKWASTVIIDSNILIREMFQLLLRQYTGVSELMTAMEKTYVLHERNSADIVDFVIYLIQIRALLTVQFESGEEAILKRGLWQLMNNRIFFQHPDLMRLLRVHEDVMTIMMNILIAQQGALDHEIHDDSSLAQPIRDASEMVVACSRFLCYFCRTSRQNQKAMFEHLSFLLDNATMLLARPSLRGSVPLDVAYSSFMDNNELALALKEEELDKVAVYLSRCGLQPNSELLAKGYPDLGWDPIEGERYIDFLRFCVWINGENVEENANLVIRLLIRRPECLGVALKGEGQGLFSAYKEAIALSKEIRAFEEGREAETIHSGLLGDAPHYPSKEQENEDYIDMGAATLDFYSSLVDLLAKCAPDPVTIAEGKGDSVRARAILRSLISLDDLGEILSLRFTVPNLASANTVEDGHQAGLLPRHKASVLSFLDRVYGIDTSEMLFSFLEQSFLPDLRAATMMDSSRALESDTALGLNRYLCSAVLPLLSSHSHFFGDAEHHGALLDATLHTVYRMNRLTSLTKNQREAVSDFLVAITHEMHPGMMVKLLRKVILDIEHGMSDNVIVPLRIITLHYDRCMKYYGSGNNFGVATEIEKRLSMLLFYAIFDSLGSKPYDAELFGRALPCLTAIGSAISPDYTLTNSAGEDVEMEKARHDDGVWQPKPTEASQFDLTSELNTMTTKFAEHFHDSWASRKMDKGWIHGEFYSRMNLTHPRLKPFNMLKDFEKGYYKERCTECIKALMAWRYHIELTDQDTAEKAQQGHTSSGNTIQAFNPRPVDLSNMMLEKEMTGLAERMAEQSHNIWAKKVFNDLLAKGGSMPIPLVPWDLLTDFERRKDRFRAQEILKFLQYHGYRVFKTREGDPAERGKGETDRLAVEKRFAYNLLEKLIMYLEHASIKMKSLKPSQELTRRNSFKRELKDVKFFEKVVLPLIYAYFNAHKSYFIATSSIIQTGTASIREKEMVANLFCRLASLLRIKNHAFGSVSKITVHCLQGLTQSLDMRTLVKSNSDIVRTSLLTFFKNCAEDIYSAVKEVRDEGQYSKLRGENLRSWTSFEFTNQMIIPVLTTMFAHLAQNHFGTDILVDEIQAACYKILDSLYMITGLIATQSRKAVNYELEKHRAGLGQCLSAFANSFPIAFLESEFNKNNKFSVMAKSQDQSVQMQDILQNLSTHVPKLEKIMSDVQQAGQNAVSYKEAPNIFDVDLPMICSYLTYWWQLGPDGESKTTAPVTNVNSEHMNRVFTSLLTLIRTHVGLESAKWLCRVNFFAVQIIPHVTCDPVKESLLPIAERLRILAERAYKDEEHLRTHPDDADESSISEDNARLVRDVYAYFPLLMKYTDLHRAQWLKSPSWETDGIYENVAVIFKIWSLSQHFKREELNYMAQFEEDALTAGELKTGKAAVAERKKKRRDGQAKKDKHASSIVIACLKRLLPVGLNVFGGRELDIVQQCKEKFLAKETEEKIREFIRIMLDIPVKTDPTDKNAWQLNLYKKIGKSQMRGKNEMTQDGVVEKIHSMGQVVAILHTMTHVRELRRRRRFGVTVTEHPQTLASNAWRKVISSQRKRAVVACFRMLPLYGIPRHRGINFFLPAFSKLWLEEENKGHDIMIAEITAPVEEEEMAVPKLIEDEPVSGSVLLDEVREEKPVVVRPDALTQLIQCFQRAATSEQKQASSIADDKLYVQFAEVMAKSIHTDDGDDEGEEEGEVDQAEKEEAAQQLRSEQEILASRGASIMCLMYLSASNGEPCEMVAQTLQLGIHLLSGGNINIQRMLIEYLQLKKDVRFFTSLAGLMGKCSVLNLEMFERQIKAEGLGMGAELAAGDNQNLNDAEFTCSLFRFLQLTCEGHNLDFQNYLRTQPGHSTSVNLIISIVDYLLRLQESIMDFYWHYSSKDVIDEGGKEYFLRAIQVCSQVFNTLTESIQGPCTGNQMTLANSRLWDAINGFFFLFAHMMEKLYKNSTQLELLREFLNLQKDMIVLMLSMLEGNVLNGSIGKQMVDALVESQTSVEMILKFTDMFLKLRDLTTSQAFQDFDTNRDGWISPKEFQRAMEQQKMYSVEEIGYLMMCTDVNNDGKVDYMEFTERFHNPARDIGFNLAILLTNLKEHITNDPRLEKIIQKASTLLEYFDPYLGRIEIMGSSKRVEKIYFEIQESWLEQWGKQQIRDSKNAFLFNVLQDSGGDQGKLEAFINFCEDTIFEMQHAAAISSGDPTDSKVARAMRQRDYFLQQTTAGEQISATVKAGYDMGLTAAIALKPSNVSKSFKSIAVNLRAMTWSQLIFSILKMGVKAVKAVVMIFVFFGQTIFRFGYYLMSPEVDQETAPAVMPPAEQHQPLYRKPSFNFYNDPAFQSQTYDIDAFGLHIRTEGHVVPPASFDSDQPDAKEATPNVDDQKAKSTGIYEPHTMPTVKFTDVVTTQEYDADGALYEPKIAEQTATKSKGSIMNMLARNFRTIEKMTLYLAFFINVILLFHRVDIVQTNESEDSDDAENDNVETIFITGLTIPYIAYELTGWVLGQILYWSSVLHALSSFAMLVSFYQLKIPLITFKREKEVARRLMFDGCWITEEEEEGRTVFDMVFWYLDRIIISAKSFPMKYWDKFIRRKTRQKFKDQVDEETLNRLLGVEKASGDSSFDYRYTCWLWIGVILTNNQFLYRVFYLMCSVCGVVYSPFFYAFHLIDVVLSFPMLKAILQSVTHNLQQLILTIMMTLVVVYLYTVLAFNFFRKFYVQQGEGGDEPDRKCHNMLTCFIYHFYAGVRAGGGIGDELESPYGDDLEYPRMLYDISFFFFVIVILLAIMQGLIIDAFGELRDQQESATEKLESSCFICDIPKETFDRMPRGFENHTTKEHNFANYLFFLQYLVNKDETEYTGQETYVREKYDNRDWEFFPVGECFLKQYEDQLLQS